MDQWVNVCCGRVMIATLATALLFAASSLRAQSPSIDSRREVVLPSVNDQPTLPPLQLGQIRELIVAQIDEQIITQMVRDRGLAKPLTVEEILQLHRDGASNELIKALQQGAPQAAVHQPQTHPEVQVYETAPSPVVIRTVPRYYVTPVPRVYVYPPYGNFPRRPPPHSGGRISFGFSF